MSVVFQLPMFLSEKLSAPPPPPNPLRLPKETKHTLAPMHPHPHPHSQTYTHQRARAHIHMYTYAHMCTYTHTHTHARARARARHTTQENNGKRNVKLHVNPVSDTVSQDRREPPPPYRYAELFRSVSCQGLSLLWGLVSQLGPVCLP